MSRCASKAGARYTICGCLRMLGWFRALLCGGFSQPSFRYIGLIEGRGGVISSTPSKLPNLSFKTSPEGPRTQMMGFRAHAILFMVFGP